MLYLLSSSISAFGANLWPKSIDSAATLRTKSEHPFLLKGLPI